MIPQRMDEHGARHDRSQRWEAHRFAAFAVRALIFLVPLVAGFLAGMAVARRLPDPTTTAQVLTWWIVTVVAASAAATVVDRFARRFLPLSTLLKMSMLFPDAAPARLRVARRSGSVAELKRRVREVEAGGDAGAGEAAELILALSAALGRHDRRTRGHSERVRAYVDMIAEELGLAQGDRDRLRWAALLHDIGKLEVPAEILNKDGELDDHEWEEIRKHPIHGVRLIAPLVPWLGPWATTIEHHHERYDGTGYPYGLAGEDIAYGARIVAVADAYDVMTSGRSYQRARSAEDARREIVAMAGVQFDPGVARALMRVAIGRLRWATGPLAALAQSPFSRGLPAIGRDAITIAASSAVMATSVVAGVVPPPTGLSAPEVVEVVIAGGAVGGSPEAPGAIVGSASGGDTAQQTDTEGTGEPSTAGASTTTSDAITAAGPSPTSPAQNTSTTAVTSAGSSTTTTIPPSGTAPPATPTTTAPTPSTTVPSTVTTVPSTTSTVAPTTTAPPPTTTTAAATGVVANDDAVSTSGAVVVKATANDTGSYDQATLRMVSPPSNGTVERLGNSGNFRYTASPGFSGTDSFSYEICGPDGCDTATIRITVG